MSNKITFFHPASLIATFFGVGKAPIAPGTFGSLAAIPLYIAIVYLDAYYKSQSDTGFSAITEIVLLFLVVISIWSSEAYYRITGRKDPKEVVIDEVVGQYIVLYFISPPINFTDDILSSAFFFSLCFFVFRFFDIIKIWPASWADKRVEGGLGIVLDDIFAAIQSIVAIFILFYAIRFVVN